MLDRRGAELARATSAPASFARTAKAVVASSRCRPSGRATSSNGLDS
jgi:hypothetical protein